MLILTDKELLAGLRRDKECFFFSRLVDSRCGLDRLIRHYHEDMFTALRPGEDCVFLLKGKDHVKILRHGDSGLELLVLNAADSAPYLALKDYVML